MLCGDTITAGGARSPGHREQTLDQRVGPELGGKPLTRGALYLILRNRIFHGEIVHKDHTYPDEHEPIIDQAQWDAVQARLAENSIKRRLAFG